MGGLNLFSANQTKRQSSTPRLWRALTKDTISSGMSEPNETRFQPLPEAARRALAEAEARRKAVAPARAREIDGRNGPEPVRYGDWEIKGIACDF